MALPAKSTLVSVWHAGMHFANATAPSARMSLSVNPNSHPSS